jgi:hypothetical protein
MPNPEVYSNQDLLRQGIEILDVYNSLQKFNHEVNEQKNYWDLVIIQSQLSKVINQIQQVQNMPEGNVKILWSHILNRIETRVFNGGLSPCWNTVLQSQKLNWVKSISKQYNLNGLNPVLADLFVTRINQYYQLLDFLSQNVISSIEQNLCFSHDTFGQIWDWERNGL